MSATAREIATNRKIRTTLEYRRRLQTGALPRTSWPGGNPLGYDVWNGMTLCADCAGDGDQRGFLWDPQNDYFLLGVRSVTEPCRCGNCGEPIVAPKPTPLCCWCDYPSEGLVDPDSPACGKHLRQYGGTTCQGCSDSVCEGQELCTDCIKVKVGVR